MRKVTLRAVAIACISPLSIYAMGLGDMKVISSLNQPFLAEIALLGVDNGMPSAHVEVATNEEYERIGLVRSHATDLLHLEITRNAKGKPIIEITSKDRMTEPFLDLLVDLSWPTGEVFKEYVVILDPPNYTLQGISNKIKPSYTAYRYKNNSVAEVAQPGIRQAVYASESTVPQSKQKLSYGPVVAGETIWQIAQHYKVPEIQLPQLVLAIVGTNPEAFTDGNLNGLKTGSQLKIPSINNVLEVPLALSPQEIVAHDHAWESKQPIKHVIEPPYIVNKNLPDTITPSNTINSVYQKALSLVEGTESDVFQLPRVPTLVKVTDNSNWIQEESKSNNTVPSKGSENAATLAALEGLRASNIMLANQLSELHKQNKRFQQQLEQREKDIIEINNQVKALTQRQSSGAQVHTVPVDKSSSSWLLWLLGLAAIGGGAFAFWRTQKPLPQIYQDTINKFHDLYKSKFKKDAVNFETPVNSESGDTEAFDIADLDSIKVNDQPDLLMKTKAIQISDGISNPEIEPQPDNAIDAQPAETPEKPNEIEPQPTETPRSPAEIVPEPDEIPQPPVEIEPQPQEIPKQPDEIEPMPQEIPKPPVEIEPIQNAETDSHVLEFETGLYHAPEEPSAKESGKTSGINDIKFNDFNFEMEVPDDGSGKNAPNCDISLLKNTEALDTMLDLAQTYISMGDKEAAKQSLEEVISFGNDIQKTKAQELIKTL